jgi:hypothetical protein
VDLVARAGRRGRGGEVLQLPGLFRINVPAPMHDKLNGKVLAKRFRAPGESKPLGLDLFSRCFYGRAHAPREDNASKLRLESHAMSCMQCTCSRIEKYRMKVKSTF